MAMNKQFIAIIGSLLVSCLIIGYLALTLDWLALSQEMAKFQFFYVIPLTLLFFLAFWLRAIRWRYLLPNTLALSTLELFKITTLGMFATFILPLRAGEIVRPLMLSRQTQISFGVSLASILTERVLDVVSILVIFGFCLFQIQSAPEWVFIGAQALGTLSALIILLMVACYIYPQLIINISHWIIGYLVPQRFRGLSLKIKQFAEELVCGLRAISSFSELLLVIFWSLVHWLVVAVFYQVSLWAMGEYSFDPWLGLTLSSLIALAIAVPSAPGFVGPYQAGCVLALEGVYGFSREFAVGYSILIHALQTVILFTAGIYLLQKMNISLAKILSSKKSA